MADMRMRQNQQRSEGKLVGALLWLGLGLIIACLIWTAALVMLQAIQRLGM
jgi:hypothetical protein